MKRRQLVLTFLAIAGLLIPAYGQAEAQTYPNRPIRIISPFPPGGGNDVLARIIQGKLADRLKATIVVENRPGAGAVIGIQALAKSPPDGYSLVLSGSTLAVAPTLYKRQPFDPNKDFEPVALVTHYPFLLVATSSLPVKSVAELIAQAKQRPGEIMYASPGAATSQHLFAELLKVQTGIDLRHIPYNGTAPAVIDIVAGRVSVMFAAAAPSIPLLKNGTLRALGVSSAARLAELPDVPPIADTVPGFDESNWSIILAPAGTPPDIVNKLHDAIRDVMAMPEVAKQLANIGMIPIASPSPEELRKFISTAVARWRKIAQQAGIAGMH
ncbi:MAG: tripartite tricarboxylate transporter substrate binding protein [Rhizobiales bacterium]|nr:tripartite tricarboxylate transporter substrate binding protein [Hyphomicrobiales bacterium]